MATATVGPRIPEGENRNTLLSLRILFVKSSQLCKQTCPRSKLLGIVVDVGQRCQPIAVLIALIVKQAYIFHSSTEAQAAYRLPRITIDNNAVVVQRVVHAKAGPINRISQDSPDYIESFPLFIHCFHFRMSGLLWLGTLNSNVVFSCMGFQGIRRRTHQYRGNYRSAEVPTRRAVVEARSQAPQGATLPLRDWLALLQRELEPPYELPVPLQHEPQ